MRSGMFVVAMALILASGTVSGQEKATPQQVVQKVRQAVGYLSQKGEAGLATFKERRSDYVWADTYVFVIDCERKKVAANPLFGFVGMPLSDLKDPTGKVIGPLFCPSGTTEGYWVEYHWPRAGQKQPARKLTYIEPVPDTPFTVGAGIYDNKFTTTDLETASGQ
ncbi:cache domain-containing protein [Skermanella pratensis]|uniref:cache domain-containing protein n=1 Tax=Skermanella pratensis TaxID=2233999 RepID=UPI001300CB80|nr:cache domain-containing protein [Skermanella pratensis]